MSEDIEYGGKEKGSKDTYSYYGSRRERLVSALKERAVKAAKGTATELNKNKRKRARTVIKTGFSGLGRMQVYTPPPTYRGRQVKPSRDATLAYLRKRKEFEERMRNAGKRKAFEERMKKAGLL